MAKPKFDESLLTKRELAEYKIRVEATTASEMTRVRNAVVIGVTAWLAMALVAYFWLGSHTSMGPAARIGAVLFPILIGVPWAWINIAVTSIKDRAYNERADAYLLEIGYTDRATKASKSATPLPSDDVQGSHFHTNGYEPERWFSYSKEQRDYMRSTGIDADTYDSNVRDHDPS